MPPNFFVGSDASVTCRSDTHTIRMEWLSEGQVITDVVGGEHLNLTFNPVNDTDHGKVYTCRVTRSDEIGDQNVVYQNFTLEAQGS